MRFAIAAIGVPCLVLLMTACTPSEASVAAAIALTQTAAPTSTALPPTATATSTHTPEPTPTPTPDLRVIDTDAKNLLLEREDFPADTYYGPPYSFRTPRSGEGELDMEIGAILRWLARYERGAIPITAPQRISSIAVLFRTIADASACYHDQSGWCSSIMGDPVGTDFLVGDVSRVSIWYDMQPSGQNRVEYTIEFTRRNAYLQVSGWGWEGEVEPEFVEQLARTLLEKVDQEPLTSEVSFTP